MVASQNPARHVPCPAESAVAQDELHVRVPTPVMPDGRVRLGIDLVERTIGHIAPAARAYEVHRSADIEPRLIRSGAQPLPQCQRVGPLTPDVTVHDHCPVGLTKYGKGVGADNAMRVLDRQVLQHEIAAVDIDDRAPDLVRSIGEIISPLREFDAGALTALSTKSNEVRVNPHFLAVQAVLDENDRPLTVITRDGADQFLNGLKIPAAVARNGHIRTNGWSGLVLGEDKLDRDQGNQYERKRGFHRPVFGFNPSAPPRTLGPVTA